MTSISPADLVIDASTGLIAVVLLISGGAKVLAPEATLRGMAGLGVPQPFQRRWIAVAFAVVELLVGLALVFGAGPVRFGAALVALAMMLGFTGLVARALTRGTDASCECFGALSRDSLDGWTLGRNIVFVLASVAAVLAGPAAPSLLTVVAGAPGPELALLLTVWIALALIAVLLRWALVERGRARAAEAALASASTVRPGMASAAPASNGSLAIGSPIPRAELVNSEGMTLPLDRLVRGRAVLLIFVKAGCGGCKPVGERFDDWLARIGDTVELRVATSSRPKEMAAQYPQFGDRVRYGALGVRRALGIEGIPAAIVLGHNGVIASPVARGIQEIEALVNGVEAAKRELAAG